MRYQTALRPDRLRGPFDYPIEPGFGACAGPGAAERDGTSDLAPQIYGVRDRAGTVNASMGILAKARTVTDA